MHDALQRISTNACKLSHSAICNLNIFYKLTKYFLNFQTDLNTKVCSCSVPSSSSSTTTSVSFFFLKSSFVILGQKKSPILVSPSKTKIPVGVRPRLKNNNLVKIKSDKNKDKIIHLYKILLPTELNHHKFNEIKIVLECLMFIV